MPNKHASNPLSGVLYYSILILLFLYTISAFSYVQAEDKATLAQTGFGRLDLILALICLASGLYVGGNLFHLKEIPAFAAFNCIWLIWVVIVCAIRPLEDLRALVIDAACVAYAPLILLVFFVASRERPWASFYTHTAFIMLFGLCVAAFFAVLRLKQAAVAGRSVVSNEVYYVLLLIPWVLSIRRSIWRYVLLSVAGIAVLFSMKRTAVVAYALGFIAYYVAAQIQAKRAVDARLFTGILAVLATLAFGLVYVTERSENYMAQRFENAGMDRGSGRLDIYQRVLTMQREAGIGHWLVGAGYNGVQRDDAVLSVPFDGVSAHNDWLEVLYDYGLPGFLLYCWLHVLLVRDTVWLIKRRAYIAQGMAAGYGIFFAMSLTSHLVLYPTYFGYLAAFWGWVYGMYVRRPTVARVGTAAVLPYESRARMTDDRLTSRRLQGESRRP